MCGISGFIGNGEMNDLHSMLEFIHHRGPDATNTFQDHQVFLGHKRLSILDLEGGHQPMSTQDQNYTIVFNGEIYNHAEVRTELETLGHTFQTDHSDTETLLKAYIEWGEKSLAKLNGMFAFAIFDKKENVLFCARDPFGQKPFYYTLQNESFIFSSELRSLCEHRLIQPEIDRLSLKKYFAHDYIPAPRTILKSVLKLPAGHSLVYNLSNHNISIKSYFEFKLEANEKLSENEIIEKLRALLKKSVERCALSDVPIGVVLSGGVDSSLMAKFLSEYSNDPIRTFTVGFKEKSFDESEYARIMSSHVGSIHKEQILTMENSKDIIPEVLSKLDEPLGDASLIPTYLVSRFTRQDVKVALGGDGGDELFAGYDPFKALNTAKILNKSTPAFLRAAIFKSTSLLPVSHDNISFDFKATRFSRGLKYDPKYWLPFWMGSLDITELEKLFGEKIEKEELYSEYLEVWDQCQSDNLVDKTLMYFTKLYLQNGILTKSDRASMMNSLELRSPFLDLELAKFASSIPARFKFNQNKTKYILKKALEGILPDEIIYRKKKGFGVPIASWLNDSDFFKFQNKSINLDSTFVANEIKAHREARKNSKAFLWNLYVLENSWVGKYL